jgi:hypothetical protein
VERQPGLMVLKKQLEEGEGRLQSQKLLVLVEGGLETPHESSQAVVAKGQFLAALLLQMHPRRQHLACKLSLM